MEMNYTNTNTGKIFLHLFTVLSNFHFNLIKTFSSQQIESDVPTSSNILYSYFNENVWTRNDFRENC